MTLGLSLGAALGAGLLSFLSPCVLPLVPAWLSYLTGYGLPDMKGGKGRLRILGRCLAFSLGFTVVFVGLGLVFAGGAILAGGTTRILRVVSGIAVILFGLNLVFDVLKLLNLEARFHAKRPGEGRFSGPAGAFLVGLAFAAGWSPCIGPILASILLLAAREGNLARAGLLLSAYSLGLALPFIATGLAFERMKPILDWAKKRGRGMRLAAGSLLVVLGALMAAGRLGTLSGIAARWGYAVAGARAAAPRALLLVDLVFVALLAALVSLGAFLRARAGRKPAFTTTRFIVLGFLAAAGIGEALGLFSATGILALWLTFQGG